MQLMEEFNSINRVQSNTTAEFRLLKSLVDIDSETKNLSGITQVQESVKNELEELGFVTELIENKEIESAPLLVATYEGECPDYISFICHADVVKSPSETYYFSFDGECIKGPGVADNKGGIVTALMGIKEYLNRVGKARTSLRFICSPNEETGSIGFHSLFEKYARDSYLVLGFEPALLDGSLVSARNGNRWYDINVLGIGSHAGRFGEPSLNSAHELSRIIFELSSLNDPKNLSKLNIGSITGGHGYHNIVCESALAKIDMRFPTFEKRDEMHARLLDIIEKRHFQCDYSQKTCGITFEIVDDCPPLPYSPQTIAYIDLYTREYEKNSRKKISHSHTGGAADVNYFSRSHAAIMDGLGPIGYGMHTNNEFIFLTDLRHRISTLSNFLFKVLEVKDNSHGERYD